MVQVNMIRTGNHARSIVVIGIILELITLVPSAVTFAVKNDQLELQVDNKLSADTRYAPSMDIDEVMGHLNELDKIAKAANGNRAVKTTGFNRTLDYITNYLSENTNFKVTKSFFYMRTFQLARNPTMSSSINGVVKAYTYSTTLSRAEFHHVQYSTSATFNDYVPLTAIPNLGCSDADWLAARPPPAGRVVLVKRGDCTFEDKAFLATKYDVAALLFYNDGTASDRIQPILVNLGQNNRVAALFLSYTLGQTLVTAVNDPSRIVGIRLSIALVNDAMNPVGNICADTPTGDPTQTIVIGSHSDSVPAGPGINDNGSGSATNLALATTLARLFQTSNYLEYKYRVRFCWWGAEELGLLGSAFHASEAKRSTVVGERIQDYLVNINLDMLGSPNFIFGIYDGKTANSNTPPAAIPGSVKITEVFKNWFTANSLPSDYTRFDGRSDYGPFLAAGVVAGGLFSGADGTKTKEQRDRYERMLGPGLGGTSGIIQDRCYHKACDSLSNINVFALDKMAQASAHAIESMARQDDLKGWLYPTKEIDQLPKQPPQQYEYNSVNEYFGLPYN